MPQLTLRNVQLTGGGCSSIANPSPINANVVGDSFTGQGPHVQCIAFLKYFPRARNSPDFWGVF